MYKYNIDGVINYSDIALKEDDTCILMKDDTLESSILLGNTLKGIDKNLNSLKEKIDIESAQISIFIFVNRIIEEIHSKEQWGKSMNNYIEKAGYQTKKFFYKV